MKKIWLLVKLFFNLIRVSISPSQTGAVLGIGESLYGLGFVDKMKERLDSIPECVQIMNQRKLLAPFDLKALQKLPNGSFGRCYADHMIGRGLSPDFYKHIKVTNAQTFSMMRLRQTHDLWHVITGFDTSVTGEIGLQAFYYAQLRTPLAPILIGGSLLTASIKNRASLVKIFESIVSGWQLGIRAKCLFAVDWEANWQTPLKQFQQELLGEGAILNMNNGNASILV